MTETAQYESSIADRAFFTTSFSEPETLEAEEQQPASNSLHRVWLSSEYGTTIPIWDEDGLFDADGLLSVPLEREIITWSEQFDELYDLEYGWSSFTTLRAHYATGIRLHQVLAAELGDGWEVGFRFWERLVRGAEVPLELITERPH